MEPIPKRKCRRSRTTGNPLPGLPKLSQNTFQYQGYFNGLAVEISDESAIADLHDNGHFGTKSTNGSLIAFLEEAFFLHNSMHILHIYDLWDNLMTTETIFLEFLKLKASFMETYVAYVFLRSKNWVVKAGLKFGGDFLLYKEGPSFYHASFIVVVRETNNSMNTIEMQCVHRVSEASKKILLMIEVTKPESLMNVSSPHECLAKLPEYSVVALSPKRFTSLNF